MYQKISLRYGDASKLSFLPFVAALFLLTPYHQSYGATYSVKINEIEYNPLGVVSNNQWIELYNEDNNLLNIGGWLVKSTTLGKTFKIPDGFVILAHDYLIITFNSVMFAQEHESIVLLTVDSVEVDRTPLLSDTANDTRTWQRFPNAVDTNTSEDWSFRDQAHGADNGFPIARQNFTLSTPIFVDQGENNVESFRTGQIVGIRSEIVNEYAEERTFAYIIQIKNDQGFTVFLSWIEDLTLLPNRTVKPAIFWLVEEKGNYNVEIFVWRSLNIPQVLIPPQSGLLRIAG